MKRTSAALYAVTASATLAVGVVFLPRDDEASRVASTPIPRVSEQAWTVEPGPSSTSSPQTSKKESSTGAASSESQTRESDSPDASAPDSVAIGRGTTSVANLTSGARARGGASSRESDAIAAADARRRASNLSSSSSNRQIANANAPDASAPAPTPSPSDDSAPGTGLTGEYWPFDSILDHVPDLDRSGAKLARLDPVVAFPDNPWNLPFPSQETFAVCWRGYFRAQGAGHYTFVVGSHDGAILEIDNATVAGTAGLHAYAESQGDLDLTQGLHVLRLRFFVNLVGEGSAPPSCRLLFAGPGASLGVIPTELLYPADGPHAVRLPQITQITPQNAKRGDTIAIDGTGFMDAAAGNLVSFGKANAQVVTATASELTVIVPPGVDQGPISVKVGDQVSPGVPYVVGGSFGLDGQFWRETDDVAVTTFMDPTTKRVPDDERIIVPVLSGPGAFGIAFPAVKFRACFAGRIYAALGGDHAFGLECDAGARLWIDQNLVVDGTKTPAHTEGKASLDPGWHDVRIDFFTNSVTASASPNAAGAKLNLLEGDSQNPLAPCPRALLAPPAEIDAQPKPVVASIEQPPHTHVGDTVTLDGTGLALAGARSPRVLLRGTNLIVHSATATAIVCEISADALSGPLTVQVGPLVSDPVNLTLEPDPNLLTRSADIKRLGPNDRPPVIDGKGDDLIWQTLDPLGAFVPCFDKVGQMTTPLTQVWVTYDSTNLYMLVQCSEAQNSQRKIIGKRHEDAIYMGDSVDFFFSLGATPIPHDHLIVNPMNVTWSAQITRPYDFSGSTVYDGDHSWNPLSWNPPVQTAAATTDNGWSVEYALPWSSLGIPCPQPGETHRVNVGRHRPAGPDFTCWSQTHQNFLEPQNFGTWTFR